MLMFHHEMKDVIYTMISPTHNTVFAKGYLLQKSNKVILRIKMHFPPNLQVQINRSFESLDLK